MNINVRFAPSPTGYLHVGGLRTALYNYLFAKQHKGNLVLRIEDTDQSRKVDGAIDNLIESLNKCGIIFDKGPTEYSTDNLFIQSNRLSIYHEHVTYLLENNYAYACFDDDFLQYRDKSYNKEQLIDTSYHVRLKIPNNELTVKDEIRGDIKFDLSLIDDPVILKTDQFPTYHLANVIDDHDMDISHVIRGEEWLPSTPIHVVLYDYFQWELPVFIHLPLLLNPDKSKLSKRQGHVSVDEFLNEGYLPEALINFIALLGWNPKNNNEIFSINELIEQFNIKNIQKSGAVFDINKLNWMNGEYLKDIQAESIVSLCKIIFEKHNFTIEDNTDFIKIINFAKQRSHTIADMVEQTTPFFVDPSYNVEYRDLLLDKQSKRLFSLLLEQVAVLNNIEESEIKEIISNLSMEIHVKGKELFFPIRLALWGDVHGPDIGLIIKILGKEKTLARLNKALKYG